MNTRAAALEHQIAIIKDAEDLLANRLKVESAVNELINTDFNQLLQLLYRLDVNEKKIRTLLESNKGIDSAPLITDLIIERQIEKIKSRRQFKQRDDTISDEERW
jgi:hypothetical protein